MKKAAPRAAYQLYVRACEHGQPAGCFSAAVCHRSGACAKKSASEAKRLFKRACAEGEARACAEASASP